MHRHRAGEHEHGTPVDRHRQLARGEPGAADRRPGDDVAVALLELGRAEHDRLRSAVTDRPADDDLGGQRAPHDRGRDRGRPRRRRVGRDLCGRADLPSGQPSQSGDPHYSHEREPCHLPLPGQPEPGACALAFVRGATRGRLNINGHPPAPLDVEDQHAPCRRRRTGRTPIRTIRTLRKSFVLGPDASRAPALHRDSTRRHQGTQGIRRLPPGPMLRRRHPEDLLACPCCDSRLVQPLEARRRLDGDWEVARRCPECQWRGSGRPPPRPTPTWTRRSAPPAQASPPSCRASSAPGGATRRTASCRRCAGPGSARAPPDDASKRAA